MPTSLTTVTSDPDDPEGAFSPRPNACRTGQLALQTGDGGVSAVIVNHNTGEYLDRAVRSLLAQSHPLLKIVVIDNGSSDDGLTLLRERNGAADTVVVREVGKNIGFAQGCNEGLTHASGPLLLFVNPDCELEPDAVAEMAAEMLLDDRTAIVGPLIRNPDGTEQRGCRRDIPTPWQVACVLLGLHRLMPDHPRFRHFNHVGLPVPTAPVEVQAVSGACMLVRRSVLEKVGVFDGGFFLHFEDVDLCLRITSAGYRIVFNPRAKVTHEKGVSSRSYPVRTEWHKHVSFQRFLGKHFTRFYPSAFMFALGAMIYTHFGFQVVRKLLRGDRAPATIWDKMVEGQNPRDS